MVLRPIQKEDRPQVLETMCAAFQDDVLYACFFPDAERRRRFLKRFMAFRLKFGIQNGVVTVTDDCAGVAIWLRPGTVMKPADLILKGGLGALLLHGNSEERKRVISFNNWTEQIQKQVISAPFWHLSPICVLPSAQGCGLGGELMRTGLVMVSESGFPCYLETQSESNKTFYEHFGFVCEDESPVPNATLSSYAMQRKEGS